MQFYIKNIEAYGKSPKAEDNSSILDASRKNSNDHRVKAVSILGERNSGTTWIYE